MLDFLVVHLPIILQLRSQYVCHKTFAGVLSHTSLLISEELPLLASRTHKSGGLKWRDRTYYTPYSNILSHPIIVMVFVVISLVACGLVIASLTVSSSLNYDVTPSLPSLHLAMLL